MAPDDVRLCCPRCRGELATDGGREPELRCVECDATYPVVAGIPDLRVFPDPYIDFEGDRAKARRVAERLDDLDLAGLIAFYYSITGVVTPAQARQFTAGLMGAEARAEGALATWGALAGAPSAEGAALLDVGCGTAPLLVVTSARHPVRVGVDIALRWLVVGKKRLAEAGVSAQLVCACAEALPFQDDIFGVVTADSVIEHLHDQPRALGEARRVLRAGGRLCVSTPNRFSLGPDPHVGIWAAGWMPQRLVHARIRQQGGIPPRRRMLSARALGRLVGDSGFTRGRLGLPDFTAGQRVHLSAHLDGLVGVYQSAKRLPVLREMLLLVGPAVHAVGVKS